MEILSVAEFADWSATTDREEYIFDSDNNNWLNDMSFHACIRFSSVVVSQTSKRIAFRNEKNYMSFERIKDVHMFNDPKAVGTVFDIVCNTPEHGVISWRFLAY